MEAADRARSKLCRGRVVLVCSFLHIFSADVAENANAYSKQFNSLFSGSSLENAVCKTGG